MRHFLPEMLQVNGGKRLKVGYNLLVIGGTLQDALPDGGIGLRTVTVFMIDWT